MKLQVIGDPVLHSKSPAIHGAMLGALGLDIPYTAHVVRRGELPDYLRWARDNGVTGFNATMPHKEDLLPLLDEIDPAAQAVGAVNTVCLRDGKWVGFNTDGGGAVAALKDGLGLDPDGMTITLLGAGGAAKAVALALSQAGAARVYVCNRTLSRAEELCAHDPLGRLVPAGFDPATLRGRAAQSGLLVNCTNLGMEGCPNQFEDFGFLDALRPGAGVFDLIYHPAETGLLAQARSRGLDTLNGLPMLVNQAVLALEHFLDRPLDRRAMAEAATAALACLEKADCLDVYEQTKYILKQKIAELFANDCSGHDDWHSLRVLNVAEKIAKTEKCDKYIVMIAALLHDADDIKLFETEDYANARYIMSDCQLSEDTINRVIDIIREISFTGAETAPPKSIEGKIVQDADRLDAIGAIGIARAFAYGGNHSRAIHIPDCKPRTNMNETEYRSNKGTTINHFYEKLLLLKDRMNTDCAKTIAEKRDGYMREFLQEFYDEWSEQ